MIDIPGYPNYKLIEGTWDVFSINFKRTGQGIILKAPITKAGYKRLNLYAEGIHKGKCIHEIVALVFHGQKPEGMIINHIDGNKLNNNPENLEYTTYRGNTLHSIHVLGNNCYFQTHKMQYNLGRFGACHSFSKPVLQYSKDGEFIKEFDSTMSVERELGIYHTLISRCCNGKQKTAGGFIWKFKDTLTCQSRDLGEV